MRRHLTAYLAAASVLACEAAAARLEISAYTGQAVMSDTKLEYRSGDDTQLTFSGVAWETKSLDSPIYYGFRLSHWRPHNPRLGIALDFTHPKAYLSPEQSVQVSGNRAGAAVDGQEPIGNTIESFNNSHGLNLLTLNLLYRWSAGGLGRALSRRFEPYVGLGAGIAIPHVDAIIDGQHTSEYQLAGPAVQGLAGVRYATTDRVGVFVEYKLSYARLDESLNGGGSIAFNPQIHQFVLGLSYGF
jgi:lipid A oxidase